MIRAFLLVLLFASPTLAQTFRPGGGSGSSGIAMGDTITSATEGSVLFAGAAGVLAQDNTNFKWVDASNYLRLGPTTPIPSTLQLSLSHATEAQAWAEATAVSSYASFVTATSSGNDVYGSITAYSAGWSPPGGTTGCAGCVIIAADGAGAASLNFEVTSSIPIIFARDTGLANTEYARFVGSGTASNGNFLIGTSTDGGQLTVNSASSGETIFNVQDSGSSVFRVDDGGAIVAEGGAVFNESSAAVDFRVESDNESSAIALNGTTDLLTLNANITGKASTGGGTQRSWRLPTSIAAGALDTAPSCQEGIAYYRNITDDAFPGVVCVGIAIDAANTCGRVLVNDPLVSCPF